MNKNFGPWTTAASTGSAAHLSTFWKKRLTMLPATFQSNARLGGRTVFALLLAGATVWALPTLYSAPPDAQQRAVEEVKPAAKAGTAPPASGPASGRTVVGSGILVVTYGESTTSGPAPAAAADKIATLIPGLRLLMQPRVVKQLALTAEQIRKLRAVGSQYDAAVQKFFAEAKKEGKLSGDNLKSAYLRWKKEADKKYLREAEAVLTPEQARTLRAATLAEDAFYGLYAWTFPGLTKAQNDQLVRLDDEQVQQSVRRVREESDRMLAVLTPEQRVKLRTVVENSLPTGQGGVQVKGEPGPLWIYTMLPFSDFSDAQVQKQLSLTDAQRTQVRNLFGPYSNVWKRIDAEIEKLSPEERKPLRQPGDTEGNYSLGGTTPEEVEKKLVAVEEQRRAAFERQPAARKLEITLRKQFEALLTPEQRAKYQDMAVRQDAWLELQNPLAWRAIEATGAQREELRKIATDAMQDQQEQGRKLGEKKLSVLTPAQREEFRSQVEESMYRLPPGAGKGGAATFFSGSLTKSGSGIFVISGATTVTGGTASDSKQR
jgi:Spy/CpxP family protein refolding chaperone